MQNEKVINLDALSPEQMEAEDLLSKAIMMIQADNLDAAMEYLQKAEEVNPQEVDIYLRQAQVLILQDELERADDMLDKAAYLDKTDARIYLHKGDIAFMHNDFPKAIENFALAEEYGLKLATMCHSMGYAYEQIGQPDQAMQAYGRAVRLDPDNPLYRLRRIQLLLQFNEVDEAEEQVVDFLKRFPQVREGYCFAVDIHFRREHYDEAEKLLNDVMKENPNDPVLMTLLVRTYTLQDRRQEAIKVAEQVMKMEDADEDALKDALECLTRLYMMEGNVDKGLDLLKKTIAAEKDGEYNVEARTLQVMILSSQQRYKELLPAVEDILAVPALADAINIVYMLKGVCLENLQRPEEAKEAYRSGIVNLRKLTIRNPMHMDAHIFRAICHKGLKEYDEALEQLKLAENLKVENAEFYLLRASIYEEKGDHEKAEADKKAARKLRAN